MLLHQFSEAAVEILLLAKKQSERERVEFIGTEQILLAMLLYNKGIIKKTFKKLNVTARKARRTIKEVVGPNRKIPGQLDFYFSARTRRLFDTAVKYSSELNLKLTGPEHFLLALSDDKDSVGYKVLLRLRADCYSIRKLVFKYMAEDNTILNPIFQLSEEEKEKNGELELEPEILNAAEEEAAKERRQRINTREIPTLEEFGLDLTKRAEENKLEPRIGRNKEIDEMIGILMRRMRNNALLVGEPGVGKTGIVQKLAQLVAVNKMEESVRIDSIFTLDIYNVVSGTKNRAEFEETLNKIINEIKDNPEIVLFIDEINTIANTNSNEGASEASASIIRPALVDPLVRIIGTVTPSEYKKYFEQDITLQRRFRTISIPEPSVDETTKMLFALRSRMQHHHALDYPDSTIEQAAPLSKQYIKDKFLPDKAIDLLDEAGTKVRLENKFLPTIVKLLLREAHDTKYDTEISLKSCDLLTAKRLKDHEKEVVKFMESMKETAVNNDKKTIRTADDSGRVNTEDMYKVISGRTGIPVNKVSGKEAEELLKMGDILHKRIIGQEQAIQAVSRAIRRARVNLRNVKRPIASFIFAGPTGVGKTEISKALAEYMFSDENNLIRFDMSEYMEQHTVARLIGSPPGYIGYNEGGQLSDSVRERPFSVVLFDEVEKACPEIFNILLQILDDGRLTDAKNRLIDFTNTIIILTTNLGATQLEENAKFETYGETADGDYDSFVDNEYRLAADPKHGWAPRPAREKTKKELEELHNLVNSALKEFFKPEFLNRIDDIIMFTHLTRSDLWKICELMLNDLKKSLKKDRDVELITDDPVKSFLTDTGYDPKYGARPLRRAITKYIDDKLIEELLLQDLHPKTKIRIVRKEDRVRKNFYTKELEIRIDKNEIDPEIKEKETKNANTDYIDSEEFKKEPLKVQKFMRDQKARADERKERKKAKDEYCKQMKLNFSKRYQDAHRNEENKKKLRDIEEEQRKKAIEDEKKKEEEEQRKAIEERDRRIAMKNNQDIQKESIK